MREYIKTDKKYSVYLFWQRANGYFITRNGKKTIHKKEDFSLMANKDTREFKSK